MICSPCHLGYSMRFGHFAVSHLCWSMRCIRSKFDGERSAANVERIYRFCEGVVDPASCLMKGLDPAH